jgi:hypothetical protein
MLLTILLGLSISTLLGLSTIATVIFTVIFSAAMLSAFVWFKLTLGIDEEEIRAIRDYIRRANEIKKKVRRFLVSMRSRATRLRPILERI